ncbi:MAG: methionyl-tRNA formyltransferase [Gammaproteobacteria bacterium]|nr:methionyl-tRNA formyltransferase [Gammaproteobacteria bacterium]MCK5262808.1 methionyl-tRNA formyltransferase [Gammaproteobacteria bacterium]
MPESIRIIYAGTPDFAVAPLEALIAAGYDVVAVYTQPDRPAGRGREPRPSPVKQKAVEHRIPVFQPESLKSEVDQKALRELKPDLMVVTAYGLLLPQAVLDIPRLGCINVHASLLPRWRGAAPIQRAILAGDDKTGITIMQMDKGLDTGDMLAMQKCEIKIDDTGSSLHDRLMAMGAETLLNMLPDFIAGEITPQKQDDALANYASKLSKQEAEIDWSLSATQIHYSVRAFNAWPVAFTHWQKKNKQDVLRVWQSEVLSTTSNAVAGTVLNCGKNGIDVATGDGVLRLLQVQLSGKKAMAAADFANAHHLDGQMLGAE